MRGRGGGAAFLGFSATRSPATSATTARIVVGSFFMSTSFGAMLILQPRRVIGEIP